MTDRKEPTDRDEIEKLAKKTALDWHKERNAFFPPDSFWFWIAERTLANFVPRSEHEELKQRYERLLARYAERT